MERSSCETDTTDEVTLAAVRPEPPAVFMGRCPSRPDLPERHGLLHTRPSRRSHQFAGGSLAGNDCTPHSSTMPQLEASSASEGGASIALTGGRWDEAASIPCGNTWMSGPALGSEHAGVGVTGPDLVARKGSRKLPSKGNRALRIRRGASLSDVGGHAPSWLQPDLGRGSPTGSAPANKRRWPLPTVGNQARDTTRRTAREGLAVQRAAASPPGRRWVRRP